MNDLVNQKKKMKVQEILFVLALATKPLYLTSSGAMQISDFIYMALLFSCMHSKTFFFPSISEKKWTTTFVFLIGYQFMVNLISYFVCSINGYDDFAMLTRIVYYIFNILVCLSIFQLYQLVGYKRLLILYLWGSAASLVICYIGVALHWRGVGRVTGFFNNPNQLGYYAILMMTVFVFYCKELKKSMSMLLIIACIVLNVLSLSKASLIGSAALLISYALISGEERGTRKTIISVFTVLIVAIVLYLVMFSNSHFFTDQYYIVKMRSRLINMSNESDSDLGTGRGYDRLKEIGLFIITGVGQGAYTRFEALSGKELHSTYASLIVSYGLIGFGGYIYLFWKAIFSKKKFFFNALAVVGIMLYSITHNGIRSSLLWTLFVMLLIRPHENDENERKIEYVN